MKTLKTKLMFALVLLAPAAALAQTNNDGTAVADIQAAADGLSVNCSAAQSAAANCNSGLNAVASAVTTLVGQSPASTNQANNIADSVGTTLGSAATTNAENMANSALSGASSISNSLLPAGDVAQAKTIEGQVQNGFAGAEGAVNKFASNAK